MKPKAYIFAGLAIVCGLGASYMTSRLLAERTPEEAEKVEILVAKRNLSIHERVIKPEDMFELKTVAKENEPPDAVRDIEALRGKFMKQGRVKGDIITMGNVHDKFGLDIPEGYQAVGVPVNLQTSVHGLANLPGSRVNLLLTMRGKDARDTKAIVLLESVVVLAADTRITPEGEIHAPAQVVTFALREKDALAVTLAKEMGTIILVLRKQDDLSVSKNRVMTGAEILDKPSTPEGPTLAQNVPPPPLNKTVEPKTAPKPEEDPKDIRVLTIGNGVNQSNYLYEVLPNGERRDAAPGSTPAPAPPPSGNPNLKTSRDL
jgi:Flp pilus assembly protein CpaB